MYDHMTFKVFWIVIAKRICDEVEMGSLFNPFSPGDEYMRQLFHCLQWYAGSEMVNKKVGYWMFFGIIITAYILIIVCINLYKMVFYSSHTALGRANLSHCLYHKTFQTEASIGFLEFILKYSCRFQGELWKTEGVPKCSLGISRINLIIIILYCCTRRFLFHIKCTWIDGDLGVYLLLTFYTIPHLWNVASIPRMLG